MSDLIRPAEVPRLPARPVLPETLIPSAHLLAFSRALAPVVVVIGDSTTVGGNAATVQDFLYPALVAKISQDNPGKTITFRNLSVGGKTWLSLSSVLTLSEINNNSDLAATGFGTSVPWLDFAEFYAPDLLIINLGTNDADDVTPFRLNDALVANAASVATWAKQPSIVLVTPNPRSSQADGLNIRSLTLNDRASSAGAIRSYCVMRGHGYLDLYRAGSIIKDGLDPEAQVLYRARKEQDATFPVNLEPTVDGEISFTLANPQDCFVEAVGGGSARQVELAFLQYTENASAVPRLPFSIRFGWGTSTRWRYQVLASGGLNTTNVVVTNVNLLSTQQTVLVSWKGNRIQIRIDDVVVFNGPFFRVGGVVNPTLRFVTITTSYQVTIGRYMASGPARVGIGDYDNAFYGPPDGLGSMGGNGVNHPASGGINGSVARVVDATNFCAAEAGVPMEQTITAAGAIDPRASHVRITGPATSTYAITLAAPGPTDGGRTMIIDMVSTTGSNTVTLALTNIIGGTAASTCTWNAARQSLTVMAQNDRWVVLKQQGVVLT